MLSDTRRKISENLESHLHQHLPLHHSKESSLYAIFPAGKLFRPLLVWAIAHDCSQGELPLSSSSSSHAYLMSSIETHHNYTLIHDDLPCMDNDDMRRGRPTVHKQFGEWQALLTGDSLLIASFALISKIKHQHGGELLKLYTWATGGKGLILGQYLDLSGEMTKSFSLLKETHKLKTSRLIQLAILGSYLLIEKKRTTLPTPYRTWIKLTQLGHHMGLAFQFLDDLSELTEPLSLHESDINSWIVYPDETSRQVYKSLQTIKKIIKELQLSQLEIVLSEYFKTMRTIFEKNDSLLLSVYLEKCHKKFPLKELLALL